MYTEEQLNLIKKARNGFFECNEDCMYITECSVNKVYAGSKEAKQLKDAGVLDKCLTYHIEDK